VYQAHFLRSLRRKAIDKQRRFPGAPTQEAIARATTLWTFDDAVTAPIHGFRDAADYYARSSSLGFLAKVRVPTLLLSAIDDPFLPAEVLREVAAIASTNPALTAQITARGGHVGFVGGPPWSPRYYLEERVVEFLGDRLRHAHASAPPSVSVAGR
jgi:predicted alpha/beta-fold hydrolase